jgi:hypothetical protein
MVRTAGGRGVVIVLFTIALALSLVTSTAPAQRRVPPTFREFLAQYKGKEVLILDKTTGMEQFVGGDASKTYNLTLNDVQNDYIVVSRTTDTDKRTFVYPMSVIRRIIYMFDNKPYQKIVIEMY